MEMETIFVSRINNYSFYLKHYYLVVFKFGASKF